MKMNRQTVDYIGTLISDKAKKKRDAIQAECDAIRAKRDALREKVDAEVKKTLAEGAKKVSAIYRKHGVTPRAWDDDVEDVKLETSNVRDIRTKFDEELRKADFEIAKFDRVVKQKQTEVVARLSLGGTAADLDAIIDAIEF